MWFLHNPGLLGINARNLLYIKAYNPKKAIMMADSKIKTKNFLSARGIPVAKLYAAIYSKKDLKKFDWNKLPNSFVVKPNSGFGGEGILIIISRKGANFIKSNGEIITKETLESHVNDIIDGRYSMANISDIAFFEQRLVAPELFNKMSYKGLADIRVVCHNLIPVMAMLRLPTEESQGKANVHLGGIAVGINIAKGELTYITQYNKEIDAVPNYGPVKGIKIPNWDKILLIASQVQYYTNLGFAAIDITPDKSGPVLLEINARTGLAVQIANMAPLRKRLERIEGIKVYSPEKGVRIAQDMFGQKIEDKKDYFKNKVIIGALERVEIFGKKSSKKIIAQTISNTEKTIIDKNIAEELDIKDLHCKFNLMGRRIQTIIELGDFTKEKFKMKIGQRDLRDFLIDPTKHFIPEQNEIKNMISNVSHIVKEFTDEELLKIDEEIVKIDSEIHLLSHLNPTNLKDEYNKFLVNPKYNPIFKYKKISFNPNNLLARLKRLEFPDSPMGILWQKKVDEIKRKIELVESVAKDDFTEKSINLYGKPSEDLIKEAIIEIQNMKKSKTDKSRIIDSKEAKLIFKETIKNFGLKGWGVKLQKEMVSDVMASKDNSIMLREGSKFSLNKIKGTIAHEIETHVFTATNGASQKYKIFQRGLADYLTTEEGLAVYNQELVSENGPKIYRSASSLIGVSMALEKSFSEVYEEMIKFGFSFFKSWKVALRAKRGLKDTSKPGAFTKDHLYFKGYKMILNFIENGGDIKNLYYGKINMKDLEIVKKVRGLKEPIYLPSYLRNDDFNQ